MIIAHFVRIFAFFHLLFCNFSYYYIFACTFTANLAILKSVRIHDSFSSKFPHPLWSPILERVFSGGITVTRRDAKGKTCLFFFPWVVCLSLKKTVRGIFGFDQRKARWETLRAGFESRMLHFPPI